MEPATTACLRGRQESLRRVCQTLAVGCLEDLEGVGSLEGSVREVESRVEDFWGVVDVRRRAQNGHWGQIHWRQAQRGCRWELCQHAAVHTCMSMSWQLGTGHWPGGP